MDVSDLNIIRIPILGNANLHVAALNVESLDVESWLHDSRYPISPYRKKHALRYVQEIDQKRSLGATLLVDYFLRQFHLCEALMDYGISAYGKPFFKQHPELHFNISHSGKFAIVAFDVHPIGVDIERVTSFQEEFASYCMKPLEIASLKAAPVEQQDQLFTTCWCLKEAVLKAKGTGINEEFPSIEFEHNLPTWHDDSNPQLTYRLFQLEDCMGAIVFYKT